MDINNICAEVESALDNLRQKDSYIKKHTILDEYQKLDREIKTKRQQMESLVKSLDFDNAQLIKDELDKLENRKRMLQTTFEEYIQLPDYEDADLLSIHKNIRDAGQAAIDQKTSQQKKLIDQILQLQQEKSFLSRTLNECIQTVREESASKNDIRFKMKLREFDQYINGELLGLLQNQITLFENKNSL